MCGIAGFIEFRSLGTGADVLKAMTDMLVHRGPDDAGYELFRRGDMTIGFGHRRLSILDLTEAGRQPMSYNGLSCVFNGEIYNFKKLKAELEDRGYGFSTSSDTEVILKGFDCWGIDMLERFIGMFSIVLYDSRTGKVYFIRDRAGVKPLYIFRNADLILFGSEIKAFFPHPLFTRTLDRDAVALYFTYSYVPTPYSIFEGVVKLRPGHYLEVDMDRKTQAEVQYWDVYDSFNKSVCRMPYEELEAETERIMRDAYSMRMVSDVPVGVFLSGGYDSTSVAALLQTGMTDKLRTFTIGFREREFNEAHLAKGIAGHLGTDHTEMYVDAGDAENILNDIPEVYDEPFSDNSVVPTILVSKLARRSVKVVLSADGGDEIFGGYHKYRQSVNFASRLPGGLRRVVSGVLDKIDPAWIPMTGGIYNFRTRYDKIVRIFDTDRLEVIQDIISQYFTEREVSSLIGPYSKQQTYFNSYDLLGDCKDAVNRLLALDFKTFLLDNNLVKVDRATMRFGLEGREPMIDHRLVEFLATVSSEWKIRGNVTKFLLKEIVHKYVPKELLASEKRPFIAPLKTWFEADLNEMLRYYLSEDAIKKSSVLKYRYVKSLYEMYEKGDKFSFQKIWEILVFQLWYSRWISKL